MKRKHVLSFDRGRRQLFLFLLLSVLLSIIFSCSAETASNEIGNPSITVALENATGQLAVGAKISISREDLWYDSPEKALIATAIVDSSGLVEIPSEWRHHTLFLEVRDQGGAQVIRIKPEEKSSVVVLRPQATSRFSAQELPEGAEIRLEGGQTALVTKKGETEIDLQLSEGFHRIFTQLPGEVHLRFIGSTKSSSFTLCQNHFETPKAPVIWTSGYSYLSQASIATLSGEVMGEIAPDSLILASALRYEVLRPVEGIWRRAFALEKGWNLITAEGEGGASSCTWVHHSEENYSRKGVLPIWISAADSGHFQTEKGLMGSEEGMKRFVLGIQLAQSATQELLRREEYRGSFQIVDIIEIDRVIVEARDRISRRNGGERLKLLEGGIELILPQNAAELRAMGDTLGQRMKELLTELFFSETLRPVAIFAPSRWNGKAAEGLAIPFLSSGSGIVMPSLALWSWPRTLQELPALLLDERTAESLALFPENWSRKTKVGVFAASTGGMTALLLCSMGLECDGPQEKFIGEGFSQLDAFWNPAQADSLRLRPEEASALMRRGWIKS